MQIYDNKQLQMWKLSGWTMRSGDFGTSATLTKPGTNETGYPVERYALGVTFSVDAPAEMHFLNGTAYALSLADIPVGVYNWSFDVAPKSSVGTALSVVLDMAANGTSVALNVFGK